MEEKKELIGYIYSSIVEENGKTIHENNMQKIHKYAIGDLVEFKCDEWHGNGACHRIEARMFIVHLGRDCDGTPLYSVSPTPVNHFDFIQLVIRSRDNPKEGWQTKENSDEISMGQKCFYKIINGLSEESLTKIEITKDIERGVGALSWRY